MFIGPSGDLDISAASTKHWAGGANRDIQFSQLQILNLF
jgi:hypothetical protein